MAEENALEGSIVAERYEVIRRLGSGGMGAVYLCRHVTLGKLVAIKFIHPQLLTSEEVRRRFDTEARAAARIKSRHAVTVMDSGVAETGQPFIVMEYLEGESLEQALRARGRLPFAEVVEVVVQVARALEQAHAAGIVHRDLKPDNVFLAKDPDAVKFGWIVKVLDFGIAKVVHEDTVGGVGTTKTGMVLGTPLFMSPEALTASAPVSPASDIWSLGACAFVAACGKVPFDGEAIGDVVLKVCAAPMPVPSQIVPDLPKAFDEWFALACARDMRLRFRRVGEMADALRRLEEWSRAQKEQSLYEIRSIGSMVDIEEALAGDEPRTSSRGLVLGGMLAGVALTIGVLGYYVMSRTRAADETARAAAAREAALIQADNERRLKEAERLRTQAADVRLGPDGGPSDAGAPDPGRGKRRRRQAVPSAEAPEPRPGSSSL
ncbi:MAG TPA: serine/threonine-protein kinase [Polyangiaceae bacterium]|jgi:serine/threonine-protein kinase|nr:serine/threonine-protein kinase [Polyangiaceae bacterium]